MKYFGTDGFRGEANVGLTVEHAYKIGRFVGWYYGANRERKARVIVGKDTRRSSYMFEAALVSGLVASGADAYMLHVIPTPGVAHQTVEGCFDCGIMISASHNPFCDNGIKLVNSDGFKMDEDVLELIEDYIDGKSEVPLATGNHIGATVDYMQGRNRYISHLIASCGFSLQGLKIGLDCANGSSYTTAEELFTRLGAEVHMLSASPDSKKGDCSRMSSDKPTMAAVSFTRAWTSSSASPMFRGPNAISFATVSSKIWYSGYWNTSPTRNRTWRICAFSAQISFPSRRMLPSVGFSSPFRCCINVDLPDPVCPMIPTKEPDSISRSTWSTAVFSKGVPIP